MQIVDLDSCHSSKEKPHNYNGHITRSRSKYLESGFSFNDHFNQETNVVVVHSVLNEVVDRNIMVYRFMPNAKKHNLVSYSNLRV